MTWHNFWIFSGIPYFTSKSSKVTKLYIINIPSVEMVRMNKVSDDFGVKMPKLDFNPHVNTFGIDAHEYRPNLTPPLFFLIL